MNAPTPKTTFTKNISVTDTWTNSQVLEELYNLIPNYGHQKGNPQKAKITITIDREGDDNSPGTRSFTLDEVKKIASDIMNLGMELRQSQLNGYDTRSGKEAMEEYFDKL